jgi:hypothetical protein
MRELRVKPEDVDCELHLVDDTLAGTVTRTEQFEVFESVVGANTLDVIDRFLGKKVSPEFFLREVTVFQHVSAWLPRFAGNAKSDVAPSTTRFRDLAIWISLLVREATEQRSAFGTAKHFLSVQRTAWTTLYREQVAALNAAAFLFVGFRASTYRAAWDRAVLRVFAVFLAVGSYVRRRQTEFCAASSTVEIDCRDARVFSPKNVFVRCLAGEPAKALRGITRSHLERSATTLANFLDRHFCYSGWLGSFGVAWNAIRVNRG